MTQIRTALLVSSLLALLAFVPAAAAKTAPAQPDLVVKKVSKPPKAKTVGTKLKLVVKVANVGGAAARKSKLGIYLGKGKKHRKKDKRLKRVKVKPLAAGKGKKLKVRVTIPAKTKLGTYRLFACADDTKKVKEAKERNCKGTRKIRLEAVPPPVPPPVPAFTMSDGLDWGFTYNAQQEEPEPGDPVTLTLAAANGLPGQAGYTRAAVPSEGFRSGNTTTFDFDTPNNSEDDGQVTVQLPFAFPFGGVMEQSISVSTNGWVSFGAPAWDYWDDSQPGYYRGIQTLVGEVDRGMMPYWADLTVEDNGPGAGIVQQVIAPDNSWVAYQWDVNSLVSGGTPLRTFQLVLFPDGRFRFDYPGENAEGGNKSFVGYSLGTGAASADIVSSEGTAVPSSGQLFTPKPLPVAGPTASGEITALLPKGSSFVSASPGCGLTTAPAKFSTGLVTCVVPALAAGNQFAQAVAFSMPDDAPGESTPANFRLLGSYLGGGLKLTDGDEIDSLNTFLPATTIEITPEYTGGNIEAGVPTTFEVEIDPASGGLDEPTASFSITNATLSSIEIDGEPIECTGLGGSSANCVLPSGLSNTDVELTVVPASVNVIELTTTARALNAPEESVSIGLAP
jgi:hypothetical protein